MPISLTLDAELCRAIVVAALARLTEFYVFPDHAAAIDQAIRLRLEQGEYDAIATGKELQDTFTAHVRQLYNDRHSCPNRAGDQPNNRHELGGQRRDTRHRRSASGRVARSLP